MIIYVVPDKYGEDLCCAQFFANKTSAYQHMIDEKNGQVLIALDVGSAGGIWRGARWDKHLFPSIPCEGDIIEIKVREEEANEVAE